ncbi:HPF/RaiA family ribosome-associated protein [Hydrogenophaga sp.]|uniref:HPF/RaiA family ribosome-associated protein n=1 Tax=Hydrogenophaga sp. TaxID=1904254 RepID=UPI003F6F6941
MGVPATPALIDHADRRLRFALTRHSDRVKRVAVRFGDENGPRGGVAKFCQIQVYLVDAHVACFRDIGTDLYDVIERATDRAGRAVVKHLDQSRMGRRTAPNKVTQLQHSSDGATYPTQFKGENT